jgi:anti-anti-sigma factor
MSGAYRHITVHLEDDVLVITVDLEQVKDYIVAEELRYELVHAVRRIKTPNIVVDLSKMKFMTSLACLAFIGLKTNVREQGGRLVLCNMTEMIRKVFNAKRLLTPSQHTGNVAFEAADSLTAALGRFAHA